MRAVVQSHQQPAGTGDQQHPPLRAGIYPKPLHPSQILSKLNLLIKNLKELRSQNLWLLRKQDIYSLSEAGLLWLPGQGISGLLVCATAEPGLQQQSEYIIHKYIYIKIYIERDLWDISLPGISRSSAHPGSHTVLNHFRTLLSSHKEVNISPNENSPHW